MWVRDEIAAAAGSDVMELPPEKTRSTLDSLAGAFAVPANSPLWERLRHSAAFQDPEGWRRISSFVIAPLLLLVEDAQGQCGFRFESVADLERVLEETSGFEFYLTNDEQSFLLAFNHHDLLIGAGDAEVWVRSLVS